MRQDDYCKYCSPPCPAYNACTMSSPADPPTLRSITVCSKVNRNRRIVPCRFSIQSAPGGIEAALGCDVGASSAADVSGAMVV